MVYSLPTEDQSPWGQLPSATAMAAHTWVPVSAFYLNGSYALKRTLCLRCQKKLWLAFKRKSSAGKQLAWRRPEALVAIAEHFWRKGWCGSPASCGICASGMDCYCFRSTKSQISCQWKLRWCVSKAVRTLLKPTSLKCFLVVVYVFFRMNHRWFWCGCLGFVLLGFFFP